MKHFFRVFAILIFCNLSTSAQLAGNYTINSAAATGGTNFQSFNDFASALNSGGVSATVTATVVPGSGPYNEQVSFDNVNATSTSQVILEGSNETLIAITDSTNRYALRLANCSYFTVNHLNIIRDTNSTHAFYGIHIYNTGDHIYIYNCNVEIPGTTSTLTGAFIASGSTTSILTTGDFHSVYINGCSATGGGYGASVFGLLSNLASDIVINNNIFYDWHSNGVYLRETQGAYVTNNIFDKRTANITSANAIQVAQSANINTTIFGNDISISQVNNGSMTIRGIYLFNGTGHRVYNNVIHNINLTSGNFTGIEVRTGATAPLIAFNTVNFDNPAASTGDLTAFSEELSNTNSVLRNNIFNLTQPTSGVKAAIALGAISTVASDLNSDYNLFYVPGGNIGIKNASTPVTYPTFTLWQNASTEDIHSVSFDPQMSLSAAPVPTAAAADNIGIAYGGITVDLLGMWRGTPPDVGAYEFTISGIPDIASVIQLKSYPNPCTDYIHIDIPSETNIDVIKLFDQSGKLCQLKTSVGHDVITVTAKDLVNGTYVMILSNDLNVYFVRINKM